jgi:hypothetical protein
VLAAPPAGDYLRLREDVLRWGMDALPAPMPSVSTEPPLLSPADLLPRAQRTKMSIALP